jgi:hypothetical protein
MSSEMEQVRASPPELVRAPLLSVRVLSGQALLPAPGEPPVRALRMVRSQWLVHSGPTRRQSADS